MTELRAAGNAIALSAVMILLSAGYAMPSGDVQVGPAVSDTAPKFEQSPGPADAGGMKPGEKQTPVDPETLPGLPGMAPMRKLKKAKPGRAPGLYPVYAAGGELLLLDRENKSPGKIARGTQFLVIGSKAAGVFSVGRSSMTWAACVQKRPTRVPAYFLDGDAAVGVPIMALKIAKGKHPDPKRARFYRLVNEVDDDTYRVLKEPVRAAVLEDVQTGAFLFKLDDSLGEHWAKDPKPDMIQMKLDFGSKVRIAGVKEAFLAVEGIQISKTYRRCLRVFGGGKALGDCAEMPHDLMGETNLLDFVAYDPNGAGRPFVLAYSTKEPLWGHERWGFMLNRSGAKRFLWDAVDAKCRERF